MKNIRHPFVRFIKNKLTLSCIFMCCFLYHVHPQPISLTLPQVAPVSPEVGSLVKYVSYPVNHSTGIPDIRIPLFDIIDKDIHIPIYLSYHASGIKPRESDGVIGACWTLRAEPSVARTIAGLPDDLSGPGLMDNDYYSKRNQTDAIKRKQYFESVANNEVDEEPDMYYFQLINQSGSFFLSKYYDANKRSYTKAYIMQPYEPVGISYSIQSGVSPTGMTLTDRNGMKYSFGYSDNLTEKMGENNQSYYSYRWLCGSVWSGTTNASVKFEYTGAIVQSPVSQLNDYLVVEDVSGMTVKKSNGSAYRVNSNGTTEPITSNAPTYTFHDPYSTHTFTRKFIKTITFASGSIHFVYNGNKIKNITVKNNDEETIRFIDFTINKFNDNTTLTKLDAVSIYIPNSNTEKRTYTFRYRDERNVPATTTKAIDHWGYFNGAAGNNNINIVPGMEIQLKYKSGSSPEQTIKHKIDGANRESSGTSMQVGILEEITSPEGVITTFRYEANQIGMGYNKSNILRDDVGGLRIQSITEREAAKSSSEYRSRRWYTYGTYDDRFHMLYTFGIPKRVVTEADYCFTQDKIVLGSNNNTVVSTGRIRTWSAMPRTDITFGNGCPVIYDYVKETKETREFDPEQNRTISNEHSTVYRYSLPDGTTWPLDDVDDFWILDYLSVFKRQNTDQPYEKFTNDDSFRYGLLKQVKYYEGDTLLKKIEYEHPHPGPGLQYKTAATVSTHIYRGKAYKKNVVQFNGNLTNDVWNKREYGWEDWVMPNGYRPVIKEIVSDYFYFPKKVPELTTEPYGYLIEAPKEKNVIIKTYEYDQKVNHMMPVKVTTSISENKEMKEIFKYPENEVVPYENLGESDLKMKNLLQKITEYAKKTAESVEVTRVKYSNGLPSTIKTSVDGTNFHNRVEYHRYMGGNMAEVSYPNQSHTCYIWSYNNLYPVAKIENSTYTELESILGTSWINSLSAKSAPLAADMEKLNNLRAQLPYSLITTYTYKPHAGITSITTPNNLTTYFDYDDWGRVTEKYTIENNQKKIISTHDYHFGISNNQHIASVNFEERSIRTYPAGDITFRVNVEGGSGSFMYTWILRNGDTQALLQSMQTASGAGTISVNAPGRYTITCRVKDNVTGGEKEDLIFFYVTPQ